MMKRDSALFWALLLCKTVVINATSCMGTGTLDTSTNICYTYNSSPRTYSDAATTCASSGTQIGSIETSSQQQLLTSLLQGVSSAVWLGGRLQQTPFTATNYRWIGDCHHCGRDGEENLAILNQGCFRDNPANRDLQYEQQGFGATLTPTLCVAACLNGGYKYAGVQNGNLCFCGNSYGRHGSLDTSVDSGACTMSCVGNSSQYCGGSNLNFIYYVMSVEGDVSWGYSKPNNFAGYQTCTILHQGVSYKLDDDNCGTTAANYICDIRKTTCPGGQAGYFYFSSTNGCYYISGGASVSWFKAREQCVNLGGDLAKINSTVIWNYVKTYLSEAKYWVGLVGRVWYWPTGDDFLYTNWYQSGVDNTQWEPNTLGNDCMIMDPSRGFVWSDSDCTKVYPFFCQKDMSATTAPTAAPTTTTSTTTVATTTSVTTAAATTTRATTTTTTVVPVTTAGTTASSTITTLSAITTTAAAAAAATTSTATLPASSPDVRVLSVNSGNSPSSSSTPAPSRMSSSATAEQGIADNLSTISSNSSQLDTPLTGRSSSTTSTIELNTGYIVLIVLCVILFIVLVICIVVCLCVRCKSRDSHVDYRTHAALPIADAEFIDKPAKDTGKIVIA